MPDRYLPIDEEGYFHFDGRRVDDKDLGRKLLENIELVENDRYITQLEGVPAWVEAFDEPLIAKHVRSQGGEGMFTIELSYGCEAGVSFKTLSIDEWDRIHGTTEKQIPFVLSRSAQFEFFDFLDEFDDDSITVKDQCYATPPWLMPAKQVNESSFWSNIYQTEQPGWEQGQESVALPAVLPQLKLNKSRVLVMGCGSGHDAAYFVRLGHMVTAVDFSDEAITRTRTNYGTLENLTILKADAFNLPPEMDGRFDLIFEHTCYCAISPDRRNDLVNVWKRALVPKGDLLGVFFVNEKRNGPPFGGSEWELRERLKSSFDFLFWTRWRLSQEKRKSKELVVYAKKKN